MSCLFNAHMLSKRKMSRSVCVDVSKAAERQGSAFKKNIKLGRHDGFDKQNAICLKYLI